MYIDSSDTRHLENCSKRVTVVPSGQLQHTQVMNAYPLGTLMPGVRMKLEFTL